MLFIKLARPEDTLGIAHTRNTCVAFVTARLRYHLARLLIVEPSGRVRTLGLARNKKYPRIQPWVFFILARPEGFEPSTF